MEVLCVISLHGADATERPEGNSEEEQRNQYAAAHDVKTRPKATDVGCDGAVLRKPARIDQGDVFVYSAVFPLAASSVQVLPFVRSVILVHVTVVDDVSKSVSRDFLQLRHRAGHLGPIPLKGCVGETFVSSHRGKC